MKLTAKRQEIAAAEGSRLSDADAQIVGTELLAIEQEAGCITPPAVVDAARPEKAPLHRFFTWDDAEAAERYREEEARFLIRSVVIIPDDTPEPAPIRAFVTVDSNSAEKRFEGTGYISTARALSSEAYRLQVLTRARDELISWRKRYDRLQEFAEVLRAIKIVEVRFAGKAVRRG